MILSLIDLNEDTRKWNNKSILQIEADFAFSFSLKQQQVDKKHDAQAC